MVDPPPETRAVGVAIRPSTLADAEAASRCHLACWRETYPGMMSDVALDQVTGNLDGRIARWRRQLDRGDQLLIAVTGTEVIGLATTVASRDEDIDLTVELAAIYVRRAWWGSGLGHRLIEAAVGAEDTYLWVLEANVRAQAFYAKHGFVPDGAVKDLSGYDATELRMVRRRP